MRGPPAGCGARPPALHWLHFGTSGRLGAAGGFGELLPLLAPPPPPRPPQGVSVSVASCVTSPCVRVMVSVQAARLPRCPRPHCGLLPGAWVQGCWMQGQQPAEFVRSLLTRI